MDVLVRMTPVRLFQLCATGEEMDLQLTLVSALKDEPIDRDVRPGLAQSLATILPISVWRPPDPLVWLGVVQVGSALL